MTTFVVTGTIWVKHALEINTKSAHLKYSTLIIQSEISPVPPSMDEGDT